MSEYVTKPCGIRDGTGIREFEKNRDYIGNHSLPEGRECLKLSFGFSKTYVHIDFFFAGFFFGKISI